jgi:hypothetical protein
MARFCCAALAALLVLAMAAPASAAPRSRNLWATINVCDSERFPNQLGVRARMPGNGTREVMYMRFRAHYFSEEEGIWHNVGGTGISRWIRLGSARLRHREAGYTFVFDPPADGGRHILRGRVEYRWKRGRRIVRRARANTKSGFESTRGADPPGFSAGVCEIR